MVLQYELYLFVIRFIGYPGNYTKLFGLRMEEVGISLVLINFKYNRKEKFFHFQNYITLSFYIFTELYNCDAIFIIRIIDPSQKISHKRV